MRKTSPIAFRPDEAQAKKIAELLAYYGLNSESQSDNILSLFEKLHEITENRKNSQRIGDALAEHENKPIDIACNCRITVKQLVRVLDPDNTGKSMWAEKPV